MYIPSDSFFYEVPILLWEIIENRACNTLLYNEAWISQFPEIIDEFNCNFEMTWDQNKFDVYIIDSKKKKKGAGCGRWIEAVIYGSYLKINKSNMAIFTYVSDYCILIVI